jgi:hypothetical protein
MVTNAMMVMASSAAPNQSHCDRKALGSSSLISISPSPSADAIWSAQSLACSLCRKPQLYSASIAWRSSQRSCLKMPEPEEAHPLQGSKQGWQPTASFPLGRPRFNRLGLCNPIGEKQPSLSRRFELFAIAAMSAGTIFCMSGDKIFMDYSSSLGPIDPQVPDREGKFLVPALGHLDKVNEIIDKSKNNTITPVEFQWLLNQDLAMLRFYEQARDLSIALLKKWLVQYKFKDWLTHRTNNPGSPVTPAEKEARATEIATLLSNNTHWNSHGRFIGISTLTKECRLDIDDFGKDPNLQKAVRTYNDVLSDYLGRAQIRSYLYNRNVSLRS